MLLTLPLFPVLLSDIGEEERGKVWELKIKFSRKGTFENHVQSRARVIEGADGLRTL